MERVTVEELHASGTTTGDESNASSYTETETDCGDITHGYGECRDSSIHMMVCLL